jgi:hypothetical protein
VAGTGRFDGQLTVEGGAAITGDLTVTGHVLPGEDNKYNLGAEDAQWANIYGVDGSLSGDLTVAGTHTVGTGIVVLDGGGITVQEGGITVQGGGADITGDLTVRGHVLPGEDMYDLGSETQRWRSGYFGRLVEVGTSVRLVAGEPDRLEYSGDGIVRTEGYLALETGGEERVRIAATG